MREQAIDHEEFLSINHKAKLKLLKTLLKDDFQTFLFVANMYITTKSINAKQIDSLLDGGLKRNYRYNKQQNR
tara:strand:+ start:1132 stop:1350 length:219 start_codon:yes stop_codon:yes gene_type:complete